MLRAAHKMHGITKAIRSEYSVKWFGYGILLHVTKALNSLLYSLIHFSTQMIILLPDHTSGSLE